MGAKKGVLSHPLFLDVKACKFEERFNVRFVQLPSISSKPSEPQPGDRVVNYLEPVHTSVEVVVGEGTPMAHVEFKRFQLPVMKCQSLEAFIEGFQCVTNFTDQLLVSENWSRIFPHMRKVFKNFHTKHGVEYLVICNFATAATAATIAIHLIYATAGLYVRPYVFAVCLVCRN